MDKRWLEHYQQGVPKEINPESYSSLIDIFMETCTQHANHVSYSNMGNDITYAKLEELTRHFGAYLQGLGLEKGARIAIMMPNLLQYPVALFAILRAGYIVVNTLSLIHI